MLGSLPLGPCVYLNFPLTPYFPRLQPRKKTLSIVTPSARYFEAGPWSIWDEPPLHSAGGVEDRTVYCNINGLDHYKYDDSLAFTLSSASADCLVLTDAKSP